MGILMAIIVYLVIFGTPFLIGWNIIKKKRPCDVGDFVAAIVLLLFYFPISSFLMVMINEDLPPYAVTNEGFMFHAEKTYGIEKFYNLAQKNLQAYQKKSGYVNEHPQWRYLGYYQFTDDQVMKPMSGFLPSANSPFCVDGPSAITSPASIWSPLFTIGF